MNEFSRRSAVGAIGMTVGTFGTHKVRASVSFSLPAAQETRPREPTSPDGWRPLELASSRYLMMPVQLNGTSVSALIDTGASRSVIKTQVAAKLGLLDRGAIAATTFTKEVTGRLYAVDRIDAGGIHLEGLLIASYPSNEIEAALGVPIDLVLGRDVLGHGLLEVDFPQDRARIAGSGAVGKDGFALDLSIGASNLASVPLKIEGRGEELAIVDLGSTLPISISSRIAAQWGLTDERRASTTLTVGVEGPQEAVMISLAEVRLGHFVLRNVPACIVADWRLSRDINIGWPMLASFKCAFDFKDCKLWLRQDPTAAAQQIPRDRSGIGATRLADRVLIRHIALHSPAERAGLKPGDEITSISGRPIDARYPAPGERFGAQAAGTMIMLGLSDGRQISIELSDYF